MLDFETTGLVAGRDAIIDIGAIRVVSTHLEFYSEAIRLAQVARLRDLHKEACDHARRPAKAEKPNSPFADTARPMSAIICGDFNSAFEDSAYCRMLAPIPEGAHFPLQADEEPAPAGH